MKKTCFSLIWGVMLFFAHSNLLAQSIDFLKAYEDKKIVSVIESKSETRQKDGSLQNNDPIPMTVVKAKGQTTLKKTLLIKPDKKNNKWIVSVTINTLRISNQTDARTTIYDSDNTFERDEVATIMASEYDPIIGKPLSVYYDKNGKISDTISFVKGIEKIRRYTLADFLGNNADIINNTVLFTFPTTWRIGESWADSSKTNLSQVKNFFEVTSISGKSATVSFRGQLNILPQRSFKSTLNTTPNEAKKQGRVEASNLTETATHEGEMVVNIDTKLINTITIRKQNIREMTVMGSKIETQSIVETTLTNTVQAIK